MIVGLGIDAVEIARFQMWHQYSHKSLTRLFSSTEIAYCLACPLKAAERFAVRYAAREALYKAFSIMNPNHGIPFLTLCKHSVIEHHDHGAPRLHIAWERLITTQPIPQVHLSLTHTKTMSVAVVILEIE